MKLQALLDDRGVRYEKHVHPTTYTAQRLADVEHVSGYLVAKPVVVKTSTDFVMCVVPAPKHVDLERLGKVLKDEQVRLATESEMVNLFPDCELGAEPPIGSLFDMKTVMDSALREDEFLIMQSGSHTEAIKARREDWEQLCKPVVADIASR